MVRPRNPRGEGERLRGELLDAAEALLVESGDEQAVTVRAIVERVGVTPPSLYRHFASKDEVVREAIARRFAALAEAVQAGAAPAAERGDHAEALRGGCLAYLRWASDAPGAYALLFTSRWDVQRHGAPADTRAFAALVEGITACQHAGMARAGDPQRLALLVWAALHGMATLMAARPAIDWPPVETLVDDLLTGLVGLPERRSRGAER